MKIKLVVGEIRELRRITGVPARNGFQTFMTQVEYRLDEDSGEVELDDIDLAKLYRYRHAGYKRKLLKVFGRTLGPELSGLGR